MASVGAIALTAGFMMMAVAGPANADKGGVPNANSNGNASANDNGNGNGNGNNGNNGKGNDNDNGKGNDNGKKTDVCHATSSMTNPYVFINVSVNAVKEHGHAMHKYEPNKTWKESAVWNGTLYAAGADRPDYIASHGDVFTEAWCEAAPTAPQPPTVVVVPPPPAIAPTDVCPNLAGNQANVPRGMDKVNGECAEPPLGVEETEPPVKKPPVKQPEVKGTEEVPTAVAAGIGGSGPTTGSSPIDLLAQMLVGGGLALLLSAGWMQMGRKANWVNQA